MKVRLLVIGYGNELRGDDGVGPAAARAVAAWNEPGVQGIATHQLTPELADAIAGAEEVVFVDARIGAGEVVVQQVTLSSTASNLCQNPSPSPLPEAERGRRGFRLPSPLRGGGWGRGFGRRPSALGHTSDPGWLLALTELVHSRVPPAWLVTIPADNLEPGERLSARAARGVADALGVLRLISRNLAAKVHATTG
jgi:hypothetical protein